MTNYSPNQRIVTEARLPALAEELKLGGGGVAGSVPIFATLAEAQAWEAKNPGKTALTLEKVEPDTTKPTAGTMTVTPDGTSALFQISGATDNRSTALKYRISVDGGTTYTAWQTDPVFTIQGLKVSTAYTAVHQVSDSADNIATGAVVEFTTLAENQWGTVAKDAFSVDRTLVPSSLEVGGLAWQGFQPISGTLAESAETTYTGPVYPMVSGLSLIHI